MKKSQAHKDIHCVFEGIGGSGNIYISGINSASDRQIIKNYSIKAILSAALNSTIDKKLIDIDYYMHIPALDCDQFKISDYFQQTYQFIEQSRKKTNVLVHCHTGISRSSTIVLAYLMKKYKYSCNQLLALLKRKRKQINPNRGFVRQLQEYELKLNLHKKKQYRCAIESKLVKQIKQKYQQRRSYSVPLTNTNQNDHQQNYKNQQNQVEKAGVKVVKNSSLMDNTQGKLVNISVTSTCLPSSTITKQITRQRQTERAKQRYHSSFIVCKSIDLKQTKYQLKSIIQSCPSVQNKCNQTKLNTKHFENIKPQNQQDQQLKIESKQFLPLDYPSSNMITNPSSASVFNRINLTKTNNAKSRFFQNTSVIQAKINRIKNKLARQYQKSNSKNHDQNQNKSYKKDQSRYSDKWKFLRVSSSPSKDNNQNQIHEKKGISFQIKPSSIQRLKNRK